MGVEIEEALSGLVDLEQAPGQGTIIFFVKGVRGDIRRFGHPEGAAVKQSQYGSFVKKSGGFTFINAVVTANADAVVL